ncbi:ribonuclease H-like domain-containing protein, partial [Ephemerocybe angulata]
MVIDAANSKIPLDGQIRRLYGDSTTRQGEVQVYVDGSCFNNGKPNAKAGAGVYFGTGNQNNTAARVPGKQTNQRGEIYAIFLVLKITDPHAALSIYYSDSEYTLKMLTERAPSNSSMGWKVEHGDLLADIAYLIKSRPGPVDFRKVKAHSGNAHNDAADVLAKTGA